MPPKPPQERPLAGVVVLALLGGGFMWWQHSCISSEPAIGAPGSPAATTAAPSSGFRVGDRVSLYSSASPGKNVPLASVTDTFYRFVRLIKEGGRDFAVADEVLERMWQVPPKTSAKVVEVVEDGYRVKIIGGSEDGDLGYVVASMVHAPQ